MTNKKCKIRRLGVHKYVFVSLFFSFIILKYENTHKKKKRTDQAIGDWLVKIKLKMSKKISHKTITHQVFYLIYFFKNQIYKNNIQAQEQIASVFVNHKRI